MEALVGSVVILGLLFLGLGISIGWAIWGEYWRKEDP